MCLLCTKKTKQYPPCKLEQHTSISPTVVSIFLLYAVTFLLVEKYGSDKHSHSKGPFTRGKTESACNRSVSHGKREVDTGSLQTHQQGRGQGRRRFNSVQCVKIFPLDLTLKEKTDDSAVAYSWRLSHWEFWFMGRFGEKFAWEGCFQRPAIGHTSCQPWFSLEKPCVYDCLPWPVLDCAAGLLDTVPSGLDAWFPNWLSPSHTEDANYMSQPLQCPII